MLLPYTTLTYYGSTVASMSLEDGIGSGELLMAIPHQTMNVALSVVGTGDAKVLRPYRGRYASLDVSGYSFMVATPHQRISARLTVNVGATPSADDIAQAVWNSLASRFNYADTMGNKLNSSGVSSGGLSTEQQAQLDSIELNASNISLLL